MPAENQASADIPQTRKLDVAEQEALERLSQPVYTDNHEINEYMRFLSSQCQSGHIGFIHSGNCDNTGKLSESAKKLPTRARFKNAYERAKLLFWPINRNQHWYLIVISRTKEAVNIFCMDALNRWKEHNFLLTQAKDFVSHMGDVVTSTASVSVPKQTNGVDCGPAIGWFARKISTSEASGKAFPCAALGEEENANYSFARNTMRQELSQYWQQKP